MEKSNVLTVNFTVKSRKTTVTKAFTTNLFDWVKLTPEEQEQLVKNKLKNPDRLVSFSSF